VVLPKENQTENKESILTEYKASQEMAIYYGKIFWTVGSIFYPATLAGFAYGISQNLEIYQSVVLGIFLILLQVFVLGFYHRIHWLSRVQFLRCQEIEKQLGLQQHLNHRKLGDLKKQNNYEGIKIADETIKPQKYISSPNITKGISLGLIVLIVAWVILQSEIHCEYEILKWLGCPG